MFFSDSANLQKFTNQFIGILAAVAIPQFDGFRKKARASEAKTNLGALYTAEKAYFYESGVYSADLDLVGFTVTGSDRYFTIGLGQHDDPSNIAATPCPATNCDHWAATKGTSDLPTCGAITSTDFKAGANGDTAHIENGFTMDQDKTLTAATTGTGC